MHGPPRSAPRRALLAAAALLAAIGVALAWELVLSSRGRAPAIIA